MAGINDDIEDGLDSHIDPSSITLNVEKPSESPVTQTVLATPVNAQTPHVEAPNEIIGKVLPGEDLNLDAKVILIEEKVNKIVDLKDVENEILGNETISQESALEIQHLTKDFFGERLTLEQFTKLPSKSNFQYSKNFLKTKIAKEELNLIDAVRVFCEEPLEELKLFSHHLEKFYIPYIADQVNYFQFTYSNVIEKIETSKNTVIPFGNELVNIANKPVNEIPVDQMLTLNQEEAIEFSKHFLDSIKAISDLFNCPNFTYFIDCIIKQVNIDNQVIRKSIINTPCLIDLVKLYELNKLNSSLSEVNEHVKRRIGEFEAIILEIKEGDIDFDKVNNMVLNKAPEIKQITKSISMYNASLKKTIYLTLSMRSVFGFLKFCL